MSGRMTNARPFARRRKPYLPWAGKRANFRLKKFFIAACCPQTGQSGCKLFMHFSQQAMVEGSWPATAMCLRTVNRLPPADRSNAAFGRVVPPVPAPLAITVSSDLSPMPEGGEFARAGLTACASMG